MSPRAEQLRDAVLAMTVRYGEAVQDYAYALNDTADERARRLRSVRRRYRALMRLTLALANLSGGTR